MAILYNLVRVYTETKGTGTLNLGDAVPGHLTFIESGVQNGDVVSYSIIDGTQVEAGRGVYSSVFNQLSRDTILSSTNSGQRISLTGTAQVMITALKQDFDHDALPNFVITKHIDHASLNINAGSGLLGGGVLTSDVDLQVNTAFPFRWLAGHIFDSSVSVLSGLHVGGEEFIGNGSLLVEGSLSVRGETEFLGHTHFDGLLTTAGGLNVGGTEDPDFPHTQDPSYPTGNLIVSGNTLVRRALSVGTDISITGLAFAFGGLSIGSCSPAPQGGLAVASNAFVGGRLRVGQQTNIVGGVRVGDDETTTTGSVSIKENLGIGIVFPNEKLHIVGGRLRINPDASTAFYNDVINLTSSTQELVNQAIKFGIESELSRQVEIRYGSLEDYGKYPYFAIAVSKPFDEGSLSERLRISHLGNVGINTTEPLSKLHIHSDTYRDFLKLSFGSSVAWDITPNPAGQLHFFSLQKNTSVFTLSLSGVGIGTDNPQSDLHLVGNMLIQGNALTFNQASTISTQQGALSLSSAGNIILTPSNTRMVQIGQNSRLQSQNYASGTTGWGISYAGQADFRKIVADELRVKNFVADQEQALAGSQIISKAVAPLAQSFIIPSPGSTTQIVVAGFEGFSSYPVFENGDYVKIRLLSRVAGTTFVSDCWGVVSLSVGGINTLTNTQTYSFTRSSNVNNAGSLGAGTVVDKGALVLDYGQEGSGYIESTAIG